MSSRRTVRPDRLLPQEALAAIQAQPDAWPSAFVKEAVDSAQNWVALGQAQHDGCAKALANPHTDPRERARLRTHVLPVVEGELEYRSQILAGLVEALIDADAREKAVINAGRKATAAAKNLRAKRAQFDTMARGLAAAVAEAEQCVADQIAAGIEVVNPFSDGPIIDRCTPLWSGVIKSAAGDVLLDGNRTARPYPRTGHVVVTALPKKPLYNSSSVHRFNDPNVMRLGGVELTVGEPRSLRVHPAMWDTLVTAESRGEVRIAYG